MRVLFTIFPATAHLHPIVPLAWALQNEGHEVRVAAHPSMADAIARTGLTAIPFGDNEMVRHIVEFNSNPDKLDTLNDRLVLRCEPDEPWHDAWLALIGAFTSYTPALDELVEVCRQWRPDLVLWDPLCVPASIAARTCGAAHARFLWGQDNVGWLWERFAEREPDTCPPMVNGSLDWLMAPMLERHGMEFEPELLLGQWTVDPRPDSWRVPVDLEYVPVRWVPYNGGGAVEDWVSTPPERPRVVLTLGVGGRGRLLFSEAGHPLPDVVRELATLDIELVVTLPASSFDGDVPDNVRIVDYVPLNQLLPSCSAIIHHGGDGTALAAGTFEVPQLVTSVPFWAEENVGRHLTDQGVGLVVNPAGLTAGVLREQLSRLLEEPQFAKSAVAFHEELRRRRGLHEVVPVLEELTARHRR
ncbi:nucleotide disphospho-sugar-binding domain-containing protein [Actinophytocola xanthii]|uniref:Uncharacterized protein n=1 Tax=Actinophytocola xanthii TaxID=1912961 RepID=A0A1Q8CS35_9PSEU|nr:nucleotide disphospho-sugar-binding domain-containing protein [Actinophytocola xanthii]OLF17182.1 hypothetical protein BU204_12350 [Actinophytocola xanthii]